MKDKAPPKAAPSAASAETPDRSARADAARPATPEAARPARPEAARAAQVAAQPEPNAAVQPAAPAPSLGKEPVAARPAISANLRKAPAAAPAASALPSAPAEEDPDLPVALDEAPLSSDDLDRDLAASAKAANLAGTHDEKPSHPGVPLSPPGIVPESDVRTHSPGAAAPSREVTGEAVDVEHLGELPQGYADGRLVSLVRDPTTLFVYWDLGQQQIEQAFGGLDASRAVLRLWNARSSAAELVREADISLDARGWYLRDLPGGVEVRVELWAVGDRGSRMLRAARPVRLPPAAPSDVLEELYVNLSLETPLPKDGKLSAGTPLAWISGGAPAGWERRVQPRIGGTGAGSKSRPWSMSHLRDLDDESDR